MIFSFSIGFLEISWVDVIDVLLVSILLYQIYKLMRGSVAVKIFLGILSLYLVYLIVRAAQMELLGLILGQFMGVGVLAAIILFQPEIRKFLLLIGKTTDFNKDNFFKNLFIWKKRNPLDGFNITPVIEAAKTLGGTNTGALIVFSRDSELKFYAESGDLVDAYLSKRLLMAIFNKNSPLHDGAVVIYKGKIKAARCVLPVSESETLSAQFGLRHRAALGMSEITDTMVLIVSEETGQFSIARNGKLWHNLSPLEMRKMINEYL
ncbi:MAG: diadenylate cyclase CdaA, partial [Bacteroidota bacterium]